MAANAREKADMFDMDNDNEAHSLSSTLRQTRVTMPACLPATKSKEGRRKGGKGNVVRKERHTAKDDTKNNSLEPKTFLCFRTADGRQAFCQPRVAWMERTNETNA